MKENLISNRMNTDQLKRAFIQYMEETHSSLLFPTKFFGCLMAVFIEQKPVKALHHPDVSTVVCHPPGCLTNLVDCEPV